MSNISNFLSHMRENKRVLYLHYKKVTVFSKSCIDERLLDEIVQGRYIIPTLAYFIVEYEL